MPTGCSKRHLRHINRASGRALTIVETLISLALIAVLFSILLPALSSARVASHRDQCQTNQRGMSESWTTYLADHNQLFPYVPAQPGWRYGGMRFASDGAAYPDLDRPLTAYMAVHRTHDTDEIMCCCPADAGIRDPHTEAGTGRRTAFRSFGTSYRANGPLLDARQTDADAEPRGLRRGEVTTPHSRLVLMGDPIWFEIAESTGRRADWHRRPDAGNILFLDGSVRFVTIKPRGDRNQPLVFDPKMFGANAPARENEAIEK